MSGSSLIGVRITVGVGPGPLESASGSGAEHAHIRLRSEAARMRREPRRMGSIIESRQMQTVRSIAAVREALDPLRTGSVIALVPTMGALHDGHVALFNAARRE